MNDLLYLEFRNHDGRPLRLDVSRVAQLVASLADAIRFSASPEPELGVKMLPEIALLLNDTDRGSIRLGFLPEIADEALKKAGDYDKLGELCWKWVRRLLFAGATAGFFIGPPLFKDANAEHVEEPSLVTIEKLTRIVDACGALSVDEVVITDRDGASFRVERESPRDVRLIGSRARGGDSSEDPRSSQHFEGQMTLLGGEVSVTWYGGKHLGQIPKTLHLGELRPSDGKGSTFRVLVDWGSKRDPATVQGPVLVRGILMPVQGNVVKIDQNITDDLLLANSVFKLNTIVTIIEE